MLMQATWVNSDIQGNINQRFSLQHENSHGMKLASQEIVMSLRGKWSYDTHVAHVARISFGAKSFLAST